MVSNAENAIFLLDVSTFPGLAANNSSAIPFPANSHPSQAKSGGDLSAKLVIQQVPLQLHTACTHWHKTTSPNLVLQGHNAKTFTCQHGSIEMTSITKTVV